MSETGSAEFEQLLLMLKHSRGFDFTGYKRSTLVRRVQKRMHTVGIQDFADYGDYLEVHPDEYRELFNTILINVTAFLRDAEAWRTLNDTVIAAFKQRDEAQMLRVWSAGCASGEETYTLLMVLAEALGVERLKNCVKVYATDADAHALNHARHATYTLEDIEPLPVEWRDKYFDQTAHGFTFRSDLRRSVIFGEHDLVQDAPISRLDLLVCRNTLIYFNSETQSRILARLHFGLRDDGFLFLGKSEMLLTHSRLFKPIDAKARIFEKVARVNLRDRLLLLAQSGSEEAGGTLGTQVQLREASFDVAPVPQLVIDKNGIVALANEAARDLLKLATRDIGKPIQDLEISYRPIDLRSLIDAATAARRPVHRADIEFAYGHELRYYDVQVGVLFDGRETLGTSVTFFDVTNFYKARKELERSSNELETAYEELQATNEELETTNEELQSTVEELETTNEELQSSNEELETMNEELQSTNEELETINEELRRRSSDVKVLNDYLEAIMTSMRAAVAVVDHNLNVTLWNAKAEDMWGLRKDEVEGKSFLGLDIGLPVGELAKPMRACLEGKCELDEAVLDATNRRGRAVQCRVTVTRLVNARQELRGLIMFMEDWAREESPDKRERAVR